MILGPEVMPLPVAITLGAIASATAPAATLMVVRQYKAKGPVTELLLPIVALDDAANRARFQKNNRRIYGTYVLDMVMHWRYNLK